MNVDITQGTGQGFAVSGPIFNLILNNVVSFLGTLRIQLKPYNQLIFLSLYADDIVLFASSNVQSQSLTYRLQKVIDTIAFNFSLIKCKYIQINVPSKKIKTNQIYINDIPLSKTNSFEYLGICWKFINNKTLSISSHVDKRVANGKKAYSACLAKNIFGNHLDIKIQLRLVDTLFKPTLEHGIRLFKYSDTQCDKLQRWYARALTRILDFNPKTSRVGLFLILGKTSFKVRNNIQLLSSFHRQFRYNPHSPSRLLLEGEHNEFIKNGYDMSDKSYSYVSEVYKVMYEYDLTKFFVLNEIRKWHKKDYEKEIKKIIHEREFFKIISKLQTGIDCDTFDYEAIDEDDIAGTKLMLVKSILSIVDRLKCDNHIYNNATDEQQVDLIYHDNIYSYCFLYKLVGIDPNHEFRDVHKFILGMYLKTHPIYWYVNRGRCRFCHDNWDDPLNHLVYKCGDYRLLQIRSGLSDPNSRYYTYLYNRHGDDGTPVMYDYIYIKNILKWIFKDYRKIINK